MILDVCNGKEPKAKPLLLLLRVKQGIDKNKSTKKYSKKVKTTLCENMGRPATSTSASTAKRPQAMSLESFLSPQAGSKKKKSARQAFQFPGIPLSPNLDCCDDDDGQKSINCTDNEIRSVGMPYDASMVNGKLNSKQDCVRMLANVNQRLREQNDSNGSNINESRASVSVRDRCTLLLQRIQLQNMVKEQQAGVLLKDQSFRVVDDGNNNDGDEGATTRKTKTSDNDDGANTNSANDKNGDKTVTFFPRVQIRRIPCLDDISLEEKQFVWFTGEEYNRIYKREKRLDAALAASPDQECRNEAALIALGLECETSKILRRFRGRRAQLAVLMMQEEQWKLFGNSSGTVTTKTSLTGESTDVDSEDDDSDAASDAADYGREEEDEDEEKQEEEENLRQQRHRQEADQREELIAASYSYYTTESSIGARNRGKICEGTGYFGQEHHLEDPAVPTTNNDDDTIINIIYNSHNESNSNNNNNRTTSDQVLVVGNTSKAKKQNVPNTKSGPTTAVGKKGTKKTAHNRLRQWNVTRATRIQ